MNVNAVKWAVCKTPVIEEHEPPLRRRKQYVQTLRDKASPEFGGRGQTARDL